MSGILFIKYHEWISVLAGMTVMFLVFVRHSHDANGLVQGLPRSCKRIWQYAVNKV